MHVEASSKTLLTTSLLAIPLFTLVTLKMAGSLKSFFGTMRKKPSRAPDGKTDEQAASSMAAKPTSLFHDLTHLGAKNTATVFQAITTLASGEPLNDKELLLENGVSMLQGLPAGSALGDKASGDFSKLIPIPSNVACADFSQLHCFGMIFLTQRPQIPVQHHDTDSMMVVETTLGSQRWEKQ